VSGTATFEARTGELHVQGHHEGVVVARGTEPLSAFDVLTTGARGATLRVLGGRLSVEVHRPGTFRVR